MADVFYAMWANLKLSCVVIDVQSSCHFIHTEFVHGSCSQLTIYFVLWLIDCWAYS